MALRKDSEIESIQGNEGTKIKQYFHPDNTSEGISYSLAQFTLDCGKRSKLHKMKSSEIYYILKGKGELKIDDKIMPVTKNDSVFVPANSKQVIKNTGSEELKFLCIVEPAWKSEDETILE